MSSKPDRNQEDSEVKPSLSLILAVFAGLFILMKRLLRRNKRGRNSESAPQQKKVMKEPVGASKRLRGTEALRSEYDCQKDKLLGNDAGLHWCDKATNSASPDEIKAANITFRIREDERDVLFGNVASEAIPGPDTLDMGGQFLTNKDRVMKSSRLFKIAQRMPKGAHLHLHFNAELDPELLVTKSKDPIVQNTMFIRSTRPLLSDEDYDTAEIVFSVLPEETPKVDLWAPDYNPAFRSPGATPWMLWRDFREIYQRKRSNQKDERKRDPDKWILDKMVLSEEEVYDKKQTTNGVWARFNQATRCFKGLMNYESLFRWYIDKSIDNMIKDGVMYAELRPMLMDKFIPSDDGRRKLDHAAQMELIIEEVKVKQAELASNGQLDKFPFGVKIIYCAPRSIPKPMMQREINDCIALKQMFPELICGFDLVGAEDRPNHIGYYRDELIDMQQRCAELGIEIPFMFHAGETLLDMGGSKSPTNSNLYDAALLKAKRIGHGFSLLKHPVLIEEFKKLDICIELCPTSNELLHLCRNIKEHPYPEILASGIPCTVNSDNPSLFSNSVSFEFYQIMVGSPTMNLHGWRQLAEWSIQYSCLSPAKQERAMTIFHDEWAAFCAWICDEYGQHASQLNIPL